MTGAVPGYTQTLQLRPEAVTVARLSARTTLACWGLDCMTDDVLLVVSELVTNAVQHARPACAVPDEPGRCRLTLERPERGTVWVSVSDLSTRHPLVPEPDDDAETGRGIAVVNALTSRWHVQPSQAGKTVWAELKASA
jgi:anti-sigma regulatory factor (Ser/Thr protein kinase)